MYIDRRNCEGYTDPTCFEALTKIEEEKRKERFRPMVYICSPYSGDTKANTENARQYCRFAVEEGCIPMAPHLFFPQFMNDNCPRERELAMFMNIILLSKCSEIWVFGKYISRGMRQEIDWAKHHEKQIRYFSEEVQNDYRI